MEDERLRVGAHSCELVGITAPPRFDRRQLQRLAEQVPCRVGQERLEPQPIGHSATERVGDADVAFADRLQQPGDATQSGGSQFERIRASVGESAEDDIDLLEPSKGSQPNTTAAGDEVSAAGEVIAEVRGEVRSLDEPRPLRLRSEQDRAWPGDIDGSNGRQRRTQIGEPSRQGADPETTEGLRVEARQHGAVHQRVTTPGRCVGVIAQQEPTPAAVANEIGGVQHQPRPRCGHPYRGQLVRTRTHHRRGRDHTVEQQSARSVEIVEHGIEHAGAWLSPRSMSRHSFAPMTYGTGSRPHGTPTSRSSWKT